MRAGLDRQTITAAAVALADEKGLAGVTLKALAAALGVKPPSLYKHIPGGLNELYTEMMLYGWRTVDEEIARAAVGKSRDDAIRAICGAFRNFAVRHPGAFEVLQWHNSHTSAQNRAATRGIIASLNQVLDAYGLTAEQELHILRFLRSFVQGFAAIETHGGFGDPCAVDESFEFAVSLIVRGIRALEPADERSANDADK